jgi:uncharacterized membrane protein
MTIAESVSTIGARPEIRAGSLAPGAALGLSTIGAGLGAGLFYGYQISVIRGLAEVEDVSYVTTFQALNDTIVNAWFAPVFFGTVPLIGIALVLNRRAPRPVKIFIALALVLHIASFAVTVAGNVPLNNDLARVDPVTVESAALARADFEDQWNRLHLVRTLLSVAGFTSLVGAAVIGRRR